MVRKIGFNYNKLYPIIYGIRTPKDFVRFISNLGFRNIYIQLGEESYDFLLNPNEIKELKRLGEENNFRYIIHYPERKPSLLESKFEIFFKKVLKMCEKLESNLLVLHLPEKEEPQRNKLIKKLELCKSFFKPRSFKICLENPTSGYYSKIENLFEFAKISGFFVTLDIGHMIFAEKGNIKKLNWNLKLINRHKHLIKILHVHMNDGKSDKHIPVFPTRDEKLANYYFLAKEIIRMLRPYSIIIEESVSRSKEDFTKMIGCLNLLFYENF